MIGILTYRLMLLAISLLPCRWAYGLARNFGSLRYRWRRTRRWKQEANLRAKLGVSPHEAQNLLQRSFELEVSDNLEAAFFQVRSRATIKHLVDIRGLQHLDDALSRGRGAILYSGHVWGNYTFFAGLGLRGYPTNLVRLEPAQAMPRVQRWFHDRFSSSVEKFGCRALWYQPGKPGSSAGVADALARNEIVIILVDLSMSKRNTPVRFFGEEIGFPTGPVAQAIAAGAPLLDFFVYRPDSWHPQIVDIGEAFVPSEDAGESVQYYASRLEQQIRKHPAEWAPWHIFTEGIPRPPTEDHSVTRLEPNVEQ